jgi:transposase
VHMRGRNKGRPNGNMKAKEKFKKLTKAWSLRGKIVDMIKSDNLVHTTLKANMLMMEKKKIKRINQVRITMGRWAAQGRRGGKESQYRGEDGHGSAHCLGEQ